MDPVLEYLFLKLRVIVGFSFLFVINAVVFFVIMAFQGIFYLSSEKEMFLRCFENIKSFFLI